MKVKKSVSGGGPLITWYVLHINPEMVKDTLTLNTFPYQESSMIVMIRGWGGSHGGAQTAAEHPGGT